MIERDLQSVIKLNVGIYLQWWYEASTNLYDPQAIWSTTSSNFKLVRCIISFNQGSGKCYDNKMVKATPHLFHPFVDSAWGG